MSLPIPAELWERLKAYFAVRRTGRVTIEVETLDGAIRAWDYRETVQVPIDTGAPPAVDSPSTI